MARLRAAQERYIPKDYSFYSNHYHHVIFALMILIILLIVAVGVVLYQIKNQPEPIFKAFNAKGNQLVLVPFKEPNLLPDTILRWSSKAATLAYNFDFVRYKEQILLARPFFTADGWQDYLNSIDPLISNIVKNKLFVNGVVAGAPVIGNQGNLPGKGYVWRVQIPFLVTFQSADRLSQRLYYVVLTIVRVPTSINPQGIGIDQYVMVGK